MFKESQKEILVSVAAASVLGVMGFAFLGLTLLQSFLLLLFFTIFLFLVLFFYGRYLPQSDGTHRGDVTDEKYGLLEKKFRSASAKAEKLEKENRTTELFLASMSHEIRTPLNGIVGLTELLDGTELTSEQQEFVSMIRESSHNLNVIVNDILDVSKINAGKMELESIPFDLFAKIEASVGMFVPKMEEKGIVLNLFTDPMLPRYVKGDPTRLSQVVINLVSNAVKFTQRDGKIDLCADYVEENDTTVTFRISVSDSGIGLTQEQQERIFEAYSQAEASTTRKAGGTGLGLTISSKIVKSMGSELKVKSQEGEGATFTFTLTLPKAEEAGENVPETHAHLKVGVVCSGKNPLSRWNTILQTYIQHYGAEYQNFRERNIFTAACPDILLIDHTAIDRGMMESFEYLSCKRVLLTSSTQHNDLEKERRIFDEIVYMPITLEKLGKILQTKQHKSQLVPDEATEAAQDKKEKRRAGEIRVLVAEDNPINQKLIKIVLEKFGLDVTLASNGEEALARRKEGGYDMVFMDIQMPVMGGVEATHRILAYEEETGEKHVPIIALTANALSGDREKYMSEGMDDYATKPLDIKAIEGLVGKYCDA